MMKKRKVKYPTKEKDNSFLRTELTFALVIHADVSNIQKIKEYINSLNGPRVVYQKASAGKLYIREEEGD